MNSPGRIIPALITHLSVVLCFVPASPAQETPARPFEFPRTPISWTVEVSQKSGADRDQSSAPASGQSSAMPDLKRIAAEQTTTARRSVLEWSNGRKREIWSIPGANVIVTESPKGTAFTTGDTQLFGDPFGPESFSWITAATRQGDKPIRFRNTDCWHFRGSLITTNSETGRADPVPVEAWIEDKTKLPVALLRGDSLGVFTFGAAPSSIEMPEKFRKRLDFYRLTMGLPAGNP